MGRISNGHRHRTTTVTLAACARQGLIKPVLDTNQLLSTVVTILMDIVTFESCHSRYGAQVYEYVQEACLLYARRLLHLVRIIIILYARPLYRAATQVRFAHDVVMQSFASFYFMCKHANIPLCFV